MESAHPPVTTRWSSILAVGFGTTVAMWGVGYLGRLPAVQLPSPWLLSLLLLCIVAGGMTLGRYAGHGWQLGLLAGSVTGLLNLLVLGGILAGESPTSAVPSALLWLPGSVLLAALLAGAGAAVGVRWPSNADPGPDWTAALVKVAIGAALLLLAVGGLVTSAEAGLAVVDWPNTFGYNMFLYPFSRMTGGIYYEHAHRLIGALVGLTMLVLTVQIQFTEKRRSVRALSFILFLVVCIQGVLGGLRVTGEFTFSKELGSTRPSLLLAVVHGVLAQLFFGGLVALGAVASRAWRETAAPVHRPSGGLNRALGALLLVFLLAQLVLGAVQRHFDALLLVHVLVGVAFVTPLAIHFGFRSWGPAESPLRLQRLGIGLIAAVGFQVVLGLGAWVATGAEATQPGLAVAVATLHQWFGAVLLAVAVLLNCWTWRLTGSR